MATKRQRERALREAREGRASCLAALRTLRDLGLPAGPHHVYRRNARHWHKLVMRAVWGIWIGPRDPVVTAIPPCQCASCREGVAA